MPLAILGAMPEETGALSRLILGPRISGRAGREFVAGTLGDTRVVVAFSRWGKVAAASTTAELILDHGADRVVFSGVAGGLIPTLRIGDVVVADRLFQHDLDASPFFAPTQVPLLGISALPTDRAISEGLHAAAAEFLRTDLPGFRPTSARFSAADRRVVRADIASGDQVIADAASRARVLARVPTAAAVEMEGAAAAQVCFEHGVPFACIRTISDSADERIRASFPEFLSELAAAYTCGIVRRWLRA